MKAESTRRAANIFLPRFVEIEIEKELEELEKKAEELDKREAGVDVVLEDVLGDGNTYLMCSNCGALAGNNYCDNCGYKLNFPEIEEDV